MSLASSLNVGVSALRAYAEGIQVVSNNIANVNTVGYKVSHAQYSDTFSNILRPLVPNENNTAVKIAPTQVGGGVQIESVAPVFSQGTIQVTNSNSDLAIAGNGFFRVKNPQTGQYFVTRAGNFRVDADGYLVTQQGFRVQGAYGAKTKVVYDTTTKSYDVKGQQDNDKVVVPTGITSKTVVGAKTTLGSYVVVVPSTLGLMVGMPISGSGIATGAEITAIDPGQGTVTMSAAGTATTSDGTSLVFGLKTVDSGSLTITMPADYSRADLQKGMFITGSGIAPGTTIETFSGNVKKTIPASSGSLTLTGVTTKNGETTLTADSTAGLAPGMLLSAGSGVVPGSKVITVDPNDGVTFTIDTPAVGSIAGTLSVVAAGNKTLDDSSNVINLSDISGLTVGMSVSGEGLPTPAYISDIAAVPNLDGTYSIALRSAAPVTLAGASYTAPTGTSPQTSTVTISDTSKLKVGDVITSAGSLLGATWEAGKNVLTVASTADLHVGDEIVGGDGIPYGTRVVSITDGTTCVLSSSATADSEKATDLATVIDLGKVAAIASSTQFTLSCTEELMGTATVKSPNMGTAAVSGALLTAQASKVYPPGNSYGAVQLAFGDATIVLSKRPTVDSFDDVTFSLGTNYTQASKVGDVKIAFTEGENFTYYGTDGVALSGIPLSAAEANGPKIRTFNVGTSGDINIILSNGQTFTAGAVLLQSFKDPGALTREGDNLFSGITTAGPYNGSFEDTNIAALTPSNGGLGAINGGSLELSNVDLGEEFSTMITTQRAFQAGSRIVTTSDQMLEEAVNLKR
jgi:flagellar hook-basal body protein